MVKTQDWLNETFPTQESREKVKILGIIPTSDNYYSAKTISPYVGGEVVNFQSTRKKRDIYQEDLTGELDLSDFVNLEKLFIRQPSITKINLDNCQKLNRLGINDSNIIPIELDELDVSKLPDLEGIVFNFTKIKEIDLTQNKKLIYFRCRKNDEFTSLGLTSNEKLTYLDCSENQLTKLDLSNNSQLEYLSCEKNPFVEKPFASINKLKKRYNELEKLLTNEPGEVRNFQLLTQLEEKENKIKEQNQQITKLEESEQTNNQIVADLKQQITKKNEEINNLQAKVRIDERSLISMQKENEALQEQLKEKNQKVTELEEQITSEHKDFFDEYGKTMEDFYKRQGINTGEYQDHLNDYNFFKKFKVEISKDYLETNLENRRLKQQHKDLESRLKIAEQLIEQSQEEIKILSEQLETKQLADRIETKQQQLTDLKQKLLNNSYNTNESELNSLCQLQKELTNLEQQRSQMETKILQIELPKL